MRRATCSRVSPAKGDGKPPSSVSATSAVSRPGRVLVPAKIRSSMASPRSAPARLSPMAQRNASAKLLLPQPLGPTRPVRPGRTSSVARSAKLLKPVRRSWARCAAMALRDAGEAAQEAQGCADGSEHRRAASAGDPALASCIIALRAITALIARGAFSRVAIARGHRRVRSDIRRGWNNRCAVGGLALVGMAAAQETMLGRTYARVGQTRNGRSPALVKICSDWDGALITPAPVRRFTAVLSRQFY